MDINLKPKKLLRSILEAIEHLCFSTLRKIYQNGESAIPFLLLTFFCLVKSSMRVENYGKVVDIYTPYIRHFGFPTDGRDVSRVCVSFAQVRKPKNSIGRLH